MRSNRSPADVTACKSHARALRAHARKLARAWTARACDSRTAVATDGRFDHIVVQRFGNAAERCD
eukprot:11220103-Lingulodinium_polyedra.AAC.1